MTTTTIKERPILFSGAMVRALLAGSKTQTRRVVKPQPANGLSNINGNFVLHSTIVDGVHKADPGAKNIYGHVRCPYGQPGERLWVRETFLHTGTQLIAATGQPGYIYQAESNQFEGWDGRWKPSIHMPRVASRLLLEIVSVRVERLSDISEADAVAEGIEVVYRDGPEVFYKRYSQPRKWHKLLNPRHSYETLWESIKRPGSWAANPWVWVLTFRAIDGKEAGSNA